MNSGKQCVNSDFCLYTVNPCEITVHVQKKKKKKRRESEYETINSIQTLTS